jgi:hypothetical protein
MESTSVRWSVVAAALLVALGALAACASPEPTVAPSDEGIDGVQTFGDLTRDHTEDPVDYPQTPPVGGDHDPRWLDCTGTVYDEQVPDELAVHALEHGAVWLTYDDSVSGEDVASLSGRVDCQPYTFLSPYPGQSAPIMLTGWGVQLEVDSVDDARIDEFLRTYRQGPQTPEPGATCEAGEMSL